MYSLGIDLGTTYTAAATWRDGHVEIASLGSRTAAVPSVVLRRDDEQFLIGEAANRRGLTEPDRVSREFKRRLGDTTPILLGGVPYSAEALMARLLRAVVADVAEREGGQPSAICISHPANWGPYKTDLLAQAARLADLEQPVTLTSEPEAAATFYAHQQRVEPGAIVAVYDLGGGTFDTAVLRKTTRGFEILGQPEGIERLGGIDFDAAVFAHVRRALGETLSDLEEDDPKVVAAVARLRAECVDAKEALSTDTDTTIPVLLPSLSTEVRLTRAELEEMVRPPLLQTVEGLRRALASAQVEPDQLHSVLLVGGSSRMPVVAQLVGAELGRPVAVDAHPKHAVAAGAAWTASGVEPGPRAGTAATVIGTASVPVPGGSRADTGGSAAPSRQAGSATAVAQAAADRQPTTGGHASGQTRATTVGHTATVGTASHTAMLPSAAATPPPSEGRPARRTLSRTRWWQLAGSAAALAVLAAGGVALAQGAGQPDADPDTGAGNGEVTGQLPPDEQCADQIRSNQRWICLTSATLDPQGQLVVEYEADWAGEVPDISTGFHMHLYGGDGTSPPAEIMGFQAADPGLWQIADGDPAIVPADRVEEVIGDAPKVCARIADGTHHLVPDGAGGYQTGNCVPISR